MIPALLHHKLNFKQKNIEDILTSNVFGLLKYVRPECGLFRFLAKAQTVDGHRPLADLLTHGDPQTVTVEYVFWPWWKTENCEPCQPDVVLEIFGSPGFLVCIEAKYWSGKSSVAVEDEDDDEDTKDRADNARTDLTEGDNEWHPSDQLAKQWRHLVAQATQRNAKPVLVYLTNDLFCPKDELRASIKYCRKAGGDVPTDKICWLSWRELLRLFRGSLDPHLFDLAALANEMELHFFEGISCVDPIRAEWTFRGQILSLDTPTTGSFDGISPIAPIRADWVFRRPGSPFGNAPISAKRGFKK